METKIGEYFIKADYPKISVDLSTLDTKAYRALQVKDSLQRNS